MIVKKEESNNPLYVTFKQRKYERYAYNLTESLTGKVEVFKYEYPKEIFIALPYCIKEIVEKYKKRKDFYTCVDAIMAIHKRRLGVDDIYNGVLH
jgi:hypothetical protein